MRRSPALAFLLVTVFIDMLGLGIVVPVVPTLMITITGHAASAARWSGLIDASVRRHAVPGRAVARAPVRPVRPSPDPDLGAVSFLGVDWLVHAIANDAGYDPRRTRRGGCARRDDDGGQRVHRRHHRPRRPTPGVRVRRCGVLDRLRGRSGARRTARRRRHPAAVLTPPPYSRSSTRCTDSWCCRNPGVVTAGPASRGGSRIRSARSRRCCADRS